ncbi:MAG: NAD(P)/FAD-dependent oxidoreductase [Methanothrix sp.]|nr:MAG: NAD(P)/FAD-dependent oxidoreductase [Methanothrix sp.]
MDQYDIAVIGAGPAGSMAAKYAAKAGSKVILLEEHSCIGWPVECAGLLGEKAMQESELSRGCIAVRGMKGATVYSPGGFHLKFKADECKAWVVDRRLFDRSVALDALRCGAELRLRSSVRTVEWDGKNSILTLADGEMIQAKIVISAEGVRARLARMAGIPPSRRVLCGAQVEVPFAVDDPQLVEVHLGEAPGLFAWVIPTGENEARIGLCARDRGCDRLRAFLKKDVIRKRLLGSPISLNVGGLPLGPPDTTVADGFLAVGDAAGQVKPTSGGGVYPGLVAGKIAGRVASKAANEGDCSAGRLREYDRLWRAALGRELWIGMKANKALEKMSAAELDELVSYLASKPALLRTIEEHGDIDRPSRLMARMLLHLDWDGVRLARLLRRILI